MLILISNFSGVNFIHVRVVVALLLRLTAHCSDNTAVLIIMIIDNFV